MTNPIEAMARVRTTLEGDIAFFCSQSCPGDVILKAQDWANARTPQSAPVIGGFHTPVERDVLRILIRGQAPVIVVLARAIEGFRRNPALRAAEKCGRALIVSPFSPRQSHTTAKSAEERNRYIIEQAERILIAHASSGGKTEALAKEAVALGKPMLTFPSPSNRNLLDVGAQLADPNED